MTFIGLAVGDWFLLRPDASAAETRALVKVGQDWAVGLFDGKIMADIAPDTDVIRLKR